MIAHIGRDHTFRGPFGHLIILEKQNKNGMTTNDDDPRGLKSPAYTHGDVCILG